MPVTASVQRATQIALDVLRDQGYTLVPFDLTKEETKLARNIMAGLLVNKMIGPLIETLERNYEEPLDCYKISGMLFRTNFIVRESLKLLLRLTGNQRVVEGIEYVKPLSEKQIDELMMQQKEL